MSSYLGRLREQALQAVADVLRTHTAWYGSCEEEFRKEIMSMIPGQEAIIMVDGSFNVWTRSWKTAQRVVEAAADDAVFLRVYLTDYSPVEVLSKNQALQLVDNWGRQGAMRQKVRDTEEILARKYWMVVKAIASVDAVEKEEMGKEVLMILRTSGVTKTQFIKLDEKPGIWGYRVLVNGVDREWHWKLRWVRNHMWYELEKVLVGR